MALLGGSMTEKQVKSQHWEEMSAESWSGLSDVHKSETLQQLNTKSQIELWAKIHMEDKANFLELLKDQA